MAKGAFKDAGYLALFTSSLSIEESDFVVGLVQASSLYLRFCDVLPGFMAAVVIGVGGFVSGDSLFWVASQLGLW